MCLVTFAYQQLDRISLIIAANRDEWRQRPSVPAQIWDDEPLIYGGQDLVSSGSWLTISTRAPFRLACVTNTRNPESINEYGTQTRRSRGLVVRDFTRDRSSCSDFLKSVPLEEYGACNLILFDGDELWYASNRTFDGQHHIVTQRLTPGVYGLSNAQLDTPWPKTVATRETLERLIILTRGQEREASIEELRDPLWTALSDPQIYPDDVLPSTGVSQELERALSAALITGEDYGTRSQALVFLGPTGARFEERLLDSRGAVTRAARRDFGILP